MASFPGKGTSYCARRPTGNKTENGSQNYGALYHSGVPALTPEKATQFEPVIFPHEYTPRHNSRVLNAHRILVLNTPFLCLINYFKRIFLKQ